MFQVLAFPFKHFEMLTTWGLKRFVQKKSINTQAYTWISTKGDFENSKSVESGRAYPCDMITPIVMHCLAPHV